MGKTNGTMGKALAGVAAVAVPLLLREVVDLANKGVEAYAEAKKDLVKVPVVCDTNSQMTLEEATQSLTECGFIVGKMIANPKIKYSSYLDMQVVGTKPEANKKVKPGSFISIRYVTSKVIEDSIKLREESDKRKARGEEASSV